MSLRYMLGASACCATGRRTFATASTLHPMVWRSLLHGAAKSQRPADTRRTIEDFAARFTVLAFDDRAARHAADIKADLEREGRVIGAYDLQIAAHARSEALTLATGNLREFRRARGLIAEDWV